VLHTKAGGNAGGDVTVVVVVVNCAHILRMDDKDCYDREYKTTPTTQLLSSCVGDYLPVAENVSSLCSHVFDWFGLFGAQPFQKKVRQGEFYICKLYEAML